jgi:hypothetical protein
MGDPAAFTAAVVAAVTADPIMQKISKAAGAQNTSVPRCIDSSPGVFGLTILLAGGVLKDNGLSTSWSSCPVPSDEQDSAFDWVLKYGSGDL